MTRPDPRLGRFEPPREARNRRNPGIHPEIDVQNVDSDIHVSKNIDLGRGLRL